jgi:hypothetical protein
MPKRVALVKSKLYSPVGVGRGEVVESWSLTVSRRAGGPTVLYAELEEPGVEEAPLDEGGQQPLAHFGREVGQEGQVRGDVALDHLHALLLQPAPAHPGPVLPSLHLVPLLLPGLPQTRPLPPPPPLHILHLLLVYFLFIHNLGHLSRGDPKERFPKAFGEAPPTPIFDE